MKIKYLNKEIIVEFRLGNEIKIISGLPNDVWKEISLLKGLKFQ